MKLILAKPSEKIVKIKVTNKKDFWYLEQVIKEGDLVYSKTTRKMNLAKKEGRKKVVKKPLFMTLRVKDLKQERSFLKIKGIIEYSSEDRVPTGKYHSFTVKVGKKLKIEKNWNEEQIKLLKEGSRKSFSAKVIAAVIDEKKANIAEISASQPNYLGSFESDLGKVSRELMKFSNKINPDVIVIASPSNLNERLAKKLSKKAPNLKERIKIEEASSGLKYGIKELIGSGEIKKIAKERREEKEERFINILSREIEKELAVYGISKVKEAIKYGAVKTLLLSEKFFDSNREKAEQLIKEAKNVNSKIQIIGTEEPMKELEKIGSVAATLRFKT